jgi:hypothetical protein
MAAAAWLTPILHILRLAASVFSQNAKRAGRPRATGHRRHTSMLHHTTLIAARDQSVVPIPLDAVVRKA